MSDNPLRQDGDPGVIQSQAERIRASGTLGRSGLIRRLFDFLVECAEQGRVPKEIEVAIDGFGKDAGFDSSQDALVRVYVHKLRRKLDEFYASAGRGEAVRLAIPRGEYRLVALPAHEPVVEPVAALPAEVVTGIGRWLGLKSREWAGLGAIGLLLALVILQWAGLGLSQGGDAELRAVRSSSVWAPLLDDDLPIEIVLGDYYIFGEHGASTQVDRLVRDFAINSREDLEQRMQSRPELAQRYEDLNLGYLPTSSAFALREVLPVLVGSGKRVSVTLASELDPAAFKTSHVVYIGYLSALGML